MCREKEKNLLFVSLLLAVLLIFSFLPAEAAGEDLFARGAKEFREGNYKEASKLLTSVGEDSSNYGIAQYLAARSFFNLSKYKESSAAVRKASESDQVLSYEADYLLAKIEFEEGDITTARKLAQRALDGSKTDREAVAALKILHNVYGKLEQYRDALATGLELVDRIELRFIGDERDQLLNDLYRYSLHMWPKDSEDFKNAFRCADLLGRYGFGEKALEVISHFEGDWPSELKDRTKFQTAYLEGFKLGEELYALDILRKLKPEELPRELAVKVDYYRSRLWDSLGFESRAKKGWKDLLRDYPGSYFGKQALSKLLEKPLKDGNLGKAREIFDEWRRKVDFDLSSFRWDFFFENFESGKYSEALEILSSLEEEGSSVRELFWKYKLSSRTELEGFSSLSFIDRMTGSPLNYYSLLTEKKGWDRGFFSIYSPFDLKGIDETKAMESVLEDNKGDQQVTEKVKRARHLARNALFDMAFSRLARLSGEVSDPYYSLLKIYWERKAGNYRRALHEARTLMKDMEKAEEVPPRNLLKLSYPREYRKQVREAAEEFSLPESIIYAVIRQESGFDHLAYSAAGARGLMQIIPSTARGIAKSLGVSDFSVQDLYNPGLNIRMGAYYLNLQYEKFGSLRLATAAYHAGGGNVSSWLEDVDSEDVDLFVEEIPSDVTRGYVKRVFRDHLIYKGMTG